MRPSRRSEGGLGTTSGLSSCLHRKGDAGTFCGGGGGLAGLDCRRVMWDGKSSSQRLFSLKSTDRKTPAVLLSSKDEAIRWNMGSTCVGRRSENHTRTDNILTRSWFFPGQTDNGRTRANREEAGSSA